ncbi:hypothetical protein HY493_04970 [Candidatus Woesearchaeota archaeon]|nr:hypothetical protein [Candidatus Woesearchaeota archaeon]
MGEVKGLRQFSYGATNWELTPEIRKRADDYMALHQIRPVTSETLFQGAMFSVLAARQDYPMHVSTYAMLLAEGFGDPRKLWTDRHSLALRSCLSKLNGPNQKRQRLVMLAGWWMRSEMPDMIVEDCNDGKKKEFELGDKFAETAPGIWYKGQRMLWGHIGYMHGVPIDTWMVKFLRYLGHKEFKQPNYRTTSGPRPDQYALGERIIAEHGAKNGLSPYMTQVCLWVAATGWTPAQFIDPSVFLSARQQRFWSWDELQRQLPNGRIPTLAFGNQKKNRTPKVPDLEARCGPSLFE